MCVWHFEEIQDGEFGVNFHACWQEIEADNGEWWKKSKFNPIYKSLIGSWVWDI